MKPCFASLPAVTLSLGLLAGVACLGADAQPTPAQPGGKLPGNVAIQLVKVADGLVDPIHVASPKDGSGRLFVCERPGVIRVIKDGKVICFFRNATKFGDRYAVLGFNERAQLDAGRMWPVAYAVVRKRESYATPMRRPSSARSVVSKLHDTTCDAGHAAAGKNVASRPCTVHVPATAGVKCADGASVAGSTARSNTT